MNKSTYISIVSDKVAELEARVVELKASTSLSHNTVKTQTQIVQNRLRHLKVIAALIAASKDEDILVPADIADDLSDLCKLTHERKMSGIDVTGAKTVMDLVQKYTDKSFKQILRAVDEAGYDVVNNKLVKRQ